MKEMAQGGNNALNWNGHNQHKAALDYPSFS